MPFVCSLKTSRGAGGGGPRAAWPGLLSSPGTIRLRISSGASSLKGLGEDPPQPPPSVSRGLPTLRPRSLPCCSRRGAALPCSSRGPLRVRATPLPACPSSPSPSGEMSSWALLPALPSRGRPGGPRRRCPGRVRSSAGPGGFVGSAAPRFPPRRPRPGHPPRGKGIQGRGGRPLARPGSFPSRGLRPPGLAETSS